jgi:hypothetical protein
LLRIFPYHQAGWPHAAASYRHPLLPCLRQFPGLLPGPRSAAAADYSPGEKMNPTKKPVFAAIAATLLLIGLSACQKPEGPAERAGKSIDEATQKMGQEIQKAGQQVQDAANEAKK